MKNAILFFLCFLSIQSFAQGYKKRTVEEKAAYFTKEIVDYIPSLTDSQQSQLLLINIQVTKSFDSIKSLKLEEVDYKKAARAIFVTKGEFLKNLFTPQQYDEFLMLEAEKRERKKEKKD
jgi:hypothetical protein